MSQSCRAETLFPLRMQSQGKILQVSGACIEAALPFAQLGDMCFVELGDGTEARAEIIRVSSGRAELSPLDPLPTLSLGARVRNTLRPTALQLPRQAFGQILSPFGDNIHTPGKTYSSTLGTLCELAIAHRAPSPEERVPEQERLFTGVAAIDVLCPIARGQRLAILAGPGRGKTTLLRMLANGCAGDVLVCGLIGERGREVQDFVDSGLHEEVKKKMITVVSTSDEASAKRRLAAHSATRIAEYYRDQGKHVVLLIDSITRVARAIREMSIQAGEVPIRQGMTNSVFQELPGLFERAGNTRKGSITAFYTLLTNNSLEPDPLADEVCSLLDGHLVLSAELAAQGVFPALHLPSSLSRLQTQVCPPEEISLRRQVIAKYEQAEKEEKFLFLQPEPSEHAQAVLALKKQVHEFIQHGRLESKDAFSVIQTLQQLLKVSE